MNDGIRKLSHSTARAQGRVLGRCKTELGTPQGSVSLLIGYSLQPVRRIVFDIHVFDIQKPFRGY